MVYGFTVVIFLLKYSSQRYSDAAYDDDDASQKTYVIVHCTEMVSGTGESQYKETCAPSLFTTFAEAYQRQQRPLRCAVWKTEMNFIFQAMRAR